MKNIRNILSLSFCCALIPLSVFSAGNTEEYCFGDQIHCLDYPKDFNESNCQGKSNVPDGILIRDKTASTYLKNYCSKNGTGQIAFAYSGESDSLAQQFKEATTTSANKKVTLKKMNKKYFLTSGFIGNNIFYQVNKEIDKNEYVGFVFTYPKKDKKIYDKYLDKAVKNFIDGYN